jgi:hypothetical protein
MLRLYQTSMNGPLHGTQRPGDAELRARDLAFLAPLVAIMLLIALWPKGLVGATTATLERTIAPAQVAADRPADQIRAEVAPNPPPEAVPLPGDEEPEGAPEEAAP